MRMLFQQHVPPHLVGPPQCPSGLGLQPKKDAPSLQQRSASLDGGGDTKVCVDGWAQGHLGICLLDYRTREAPGTGRQGGRCSRPGAGHL